MIEIDTGIDRHFNIEHRGVAGADCEAVGGGGALAVEQRMHDQRAGIRARASRSRTS